MSLKSLGYIGVQSTKLEDWSGFATGLLGMQQVDAAAKVRAFRMDDRKQRLVVTGAENDGLDSSAGRRKARRISMNWRAVSTRPAWP